jgi:hypothetical protein
LPFNPHALLGRLNSLAPVLSECVPS